MDFIVDTNLFYYLSDGWISRADIGGATDDLFISPIVILELISGLDRSNAQYRRKIFETIAHNNIRLVPDPETWIVTRANAKLTQEPFDWQLLLDAMRTVVTYDDVRQAMLYWPPPGTRPMRTRWLDIRLANSWNARHEKDWRENLEATLKRYVPNTNEWFSTKSGPRPKMPSSLKRIVGPVLNHDNMLDDIAAGLALRLLPLSGDGVNLNPASTRSVADTYIRIFRQYLIDILLKQSVPKENDRWDIEFFLYLGAPGTRFATAEPRWENVAKDAGFPSAVKRILIES